ncbi:hypothetical protein SAMN04489761_0840 [Tenacibaculum sp. MAR_2009_124]|uniref:hypothetical protein n=1 Tax=Tenacibaculum sp. MAR_2009_124 TaxID=1250059 RepID=UPI000896B28C|nr:hypothetical protein [Tenacibaculum sp. MAR_2009_124]SEB45876.1 hypothetical protein SAMN04489761_0840 [Tenacibaculum sp. MAR_2009_124]
MRQILNIKDDEVIIYEITDQYLFECHRSNKVVMNKSLYLNYLSICDFEKITLDRTQCIFSQEWITHYGTLKTDGNWLWSTDLEHYFEKYNFKWPKDHLLKITNSNYQMSKKSKSIIEERRELGHKLVSQTSSPGEVNHFKDLIIQGRKIKKMTT